MNIVKISNSLAITQTEFKGIRIKEDSSKVNKKGYYSIVISFGNSEEVEVASFYDGQFEYAQLWLYRYLYMFSVTKDIGLIEFTEKDKNWFIGVTQEFVTVTMNASVYSQSNEIDEQDKCDVSVADLDNKDYYNQIFDDLLKKKITFSKQAYSLLKRRLVDDYRSLIKDYINKVIVNGEDW